MSNQEKYIIFKVQKYSKSMYIISKYFLGNPLSCAL